jgi:RNase P/RNase MRP subunit POP5
MKSKKMLFGKKRYLVFKLKKDMDSDSAHKFIYGQLLRCLGTFGLEKVKYRFFNERYDANKKTGIIRVSVDSLNDVKRAFDLIKDQITIIGISGIIKKTSRFIINENEKNNELNNSKNES